MDFKAKNWFDKLVIILRGFGLIFLYAISSSLIIALIFPNFNKSYYNKPSFGLCLMIIDILIMCALLLLFYKRIIRDFKDFKQNYKKYFKIIIPYWVIGFIIMMFSNIIINMVISKGGLAANEEANRQILTSLPIYSLLSMCIIGPICEELLFRASFKNAFKNIITFSLFTGLIFAGIHVISGVDFSSLNTILKSWKELLYFIPYGSLGIAFGYAFYKTDNIFSSISLHIMHNTITVLFILFAYITGGA